MAERCFQQAIAFQASCAAVEACFQDLELMHRWLNPLLRCRPEGDWNLDRGSRNRFQIQIPLIYPSLECVVCDRAEGLIVWQFEGFFQGTDTWRWWQEGEHTQLDNCFRFRIAKPWVAWGFDRVAAGVTQRDMQAQLQRLKAIAETLPVASTVTDNLPSPSPEAAASPSTPADRPL
ncbi:hypothetical protein syc0280_d [Synechococcus elongatus PCC 6301]|uniref:Polyketide cyclase n=1 Tax=Synechococcus sp. (strain ATCC 27144 / PCC 6301 / SAUG 1402/1) TaxID=269084 RepID=A0A0H3K2W1_SYNP6|nr:SRPBCC family protein [Synechococcus elongatus]BAD78470.1 hypothetical protein syc0280_d [Synechococcus elongatus PCC 6301]